MSNEHLLSTSDNPYNPWTQWDDWFAWDYPRYNSLSLLGRMVWTSDELPKPLQDAASEDAVDTVVSDNFSGVHIKVEKPSDYKDPNS